MFLITDPGLCFKQGVSLRSLCSPGGGNGSPLQYSCLENPTNRGAWQATGHGVAESDKAEWLSVHRHTHSYSWRILTLVGSKQDLLWFCLPRSAVLLSSSLPRHSFMTSWDILKPFWSSFKFFLRWSIVDLQCYVGYRCIAEWFSDTLNLLMYFLPFQNIHLCHLSHHLPKSRFPSL